MKPIRMGVVGVGSMGYNHARICSELPQIELVGVVDNCETRANEVAEKFSVQAYTDPRDLIGKVEAVSIVTPTPLHYDITKMFLENGIHVLVEKPITVGAEEGRELVDIANKRGLILLVGHLERFNPAMLKLREMVRHPILLECHRLSGTTTRNLDVGISWDLMIHDYDILLSLLKDEVVDISAQGISIYSKFEDIALVQLRFAHGAIANLIASRNSAERSRGMKVTEKDGRILWLDYIEQSLKIATLGSDGRPEAIEDVPLEKTEPLKSEIAHFVDCIINSKVPLVSGEDGLKALELAIRVRSRMQVGEFCL